MPPASDAPLICVLNFCGNGSGNYGDANDGSSRSHAFFNCDDAGTVEAAILHAVADPIQGRHGGIGSTFLVFSFLAYNGTAIWFFFFIQTTRK